MLAMTAPPVICGQAKVPYAQLDQVYYVVQSQCGNGWDIKVWLERMTSRGWRKVPDSQVLWQVGGTDLGGWYIQYPLPGTYRARGEMGSPGCPSCSNPTVLPSRPVTIVLPANGKDAPGS